MNWLDIVKLVLPMVLSAAHVPEAVIPIVSAGVPEAEALFGDGKGADKLQHVTNLAKGVVEGINAAKPGTIDSAQAHQAVVDGVNTAIEAANLIKKRLPPTAGVR